MENTPYKRKVQIREKKAQKAAKREERRRAKKLKREQLADAKLDVTIAESTPDNDNDNDGMSS